MQRDAHIHTPFCPHGSADTFVHYCERAIALGIRDISFTEHAPLPKSFIDTTPTQDSGMSYNQMEAYIKEVKRVQKIYANDLRVRVGLELDYIEGFEEETTAFLDNYGQELDDSILSVHFLKLPNNSYVCIDYSKEVYLDTVQQLKSSEQLYSLYYATVLKSITTSLGNWKPNRIGHLSLIHKFQHALPSLPDDRQHLLEVLSAIKSAGMEIDMNSAGLAKSFCREPYPPLAIAQLAQAQGIPLVFGSDAHVANDLHQFAEHFTEFEK
ncbi:histidinol-phosphatase HisJ [Chryseomicrobium sp. FSL W7-1435]|uniref:histidinol-phosphatase HisJ n=1 Tax=Chryseomicrobium sp. FSL W7-1435 TaxID=2921704 RepID=UPI00315A6853